MVPVIMGKSKKKTIPTVSDIDPGKNEFGSKETEIPLTLSMENSQEAMDIFTVSPLQSPTSVNVLFKESARFILKRSDNFLSSKLFQSLKKTFPYYKSAPRLPLKITFSNPKP